MIPLRHLISQLSLTASPRGEAISGLHRLCDAFFMPSVGRYFMPRRGISCCRRAVFHAGHRPVFHFPTPPKVGFHPSEGRLVSSVSCSWQLLEVELYTEKSRLFYLLFLHYFSSWDQSKFSLSSNHSSLPSVVPATLWK